MMEKIIGGIIILGVLILELSFVSSAHFVVGRVNEALDGTSPNDLEIVLWNYNNGLQDNLTDIVGSAGNSGQSNLYMVDCELLETACQMGDIISIKIFDNGDGGYFNSEEVNVTITGAGFDLAENLTLNSPPNITSIFVDDFVYLPAGEVDLIAGGQKLVSCVANVTELDGDSLQNPNASFFASGYFFETPDDNNYHYLNDTCNVDTGFGNENESQINCTFSLEYYSNPGSWDCQIVIEDIYGAKRNLTTNTNVNELLAVELINYVDYGLVEVNNVSSEAVLNVTNMGNVMVNLSLSGYGEVPEDDLAMKCLSGEIPVGFAKYNLTDSMGGELTYEQFEGNYTNLTKDPRIKELNLGARENDLENDKINETYWRIYVPADVAGTCSGAILFGAIKAQAI